MALLFVLTMIHVSQFPPPMPTLTSNLWFWFSTSLGTWEGTDPQLLAKTTLGI